VVNQSNATSPQDSVTKLSFSGTLIGSTSTITLPLSYSSPGVLTTAAPNFVATTEQSQAYVLMPKYEPNPPQVVPSVAVINTTTNAIVTTLPVISNLVANSVANPVAMAETPDGTKLYVANSGQPMTESTWTISAFNTKDRSMRQICVDGTCPTGATPIPLASPPIWISARSDSQRVYVLKLDGTVAYIDTSTTAGPDQLYDNYTPLVQAPGAAYMWYDVILNRLYIPGGSQATVVDVSQATPQTLATIPIGPVSSSQRTSGDVCSTFSPPSVTAAAVTSLPDGSRAYVGSFAEFEVDVNILAATPNPDGTTTYTYSLQSPIDLLPGMIITISGAIPSDYNGIFTILSVGGGMFKVANKPKDTYQSGGIGVAPNVCPQVTVVDAQNVSTKTTIVTPGIPAPLPAYSFCGDPAQVRFRWNMAAGGDSSRAYLASCDGGNVNIVYTSTDTYAETAPAPGGTGAPIPPSSQNPPQNPVFMLAGP